MNREPAVHLRQRAQQYIRTAQAAHTAGDLDAAFENARTGAELAAKARLAAAGVPYGAGHNVAGALVQAGLWPKSRGARLSQLLQEYVRGVYTFTKPVRDRDVSQAIAVAQELAAEPTQ